MTTRSGSRIRQPSVPRVKEETPSTTNGNAPHTNTTEKETSIPTTAESEEPDAQSTAAAIKDTFLKVPDLVSQKASKLGQGLKTDNVDTTEIEARKAYWKKIYERTSFGFLMIGGFISALKWQNDDISC